ncbi:efflux RND transporter permease subunit [Cochlodiniinecator piscidefendens]|uniref:efflux RND transporter permease subunit n=1 Tax=Cochlodiniinecator piscidefendens TaxID=2715756 RepID=UPI00140BBA54|nr:efflux RND transporter permease subunit [Cochlodiniinecator piscidefendens]
MSIARGSINNPLLTWMVMLGCLFGGIFGFFNLGRLEDPAFTIKQAVIVTQYPGASAEEVAAEISEPLEAAIQKMGEVERITSRNTPGMSLIDVEMRSNFDGTELPAIWVDLRNNVNDVRLPSGAQPPIVNDSFGDVFGIFFAVTAEGFSDAEKYELATYLRRELLAVQGVADVNTAGLPEENIFVEPSSPVMVNLGVPPTAIANAIANANSLTAAGSFLDGSDRLRILTPEGSDSVSEIAGLAIGVGGAVINLADIGEVSRSRVELPSQIIRFNGTEAFTLGVSGLAQENIVDVGNRVDARLAQMQQNIPAGVEIFPIYQQHLVVDAASQNFLLNLAISVAIVVAVLAVAMGPRAAVVVGGTLFLTVVGTVFFMFLFSIEMERISLGALIIAMGMLVDNAIVVAEGMQNAMRHGKSSREAADEAVSKTQIPLLGATAIAIMAFAGIGLSNDATGEFLFSLFAVIGISLTLSWILAISVTPLLGHYFFKTEEAGAGEAYNSLLFNLYGAALRWAMKLRWLVIAGLIGLTVVCVMAFGSVKQQFFPDSNTPIFYVHMKLQEGTDINETSDKLELFEAWLADQETVVSTSAFVGEGATRFILTYGAEQSDPSYGHLIVRTSTLDEIPPLIADIEAYAAEALPEGEFRTERMVFGPGGGAPIEVRLSGPDRDVLRALSDEVATTLRSASENVHSLRTDWRERSLVLQPIYAAERAQTAGVTRDAIANVLLLATDGFQAGVYRENERLIPIVIRQSAAERAQSGHLLNQVIYSDSANQYVPIEQVIDGFDYVVTDNTIRRRDRVPTITVRASISSDLTAAAVFTEVQHAIEALELPSGYSLAWGGDHESSGDANASLGSTLPVTFLIMVLISILLFNALRQPLVIWLLVPMSINGVALGLLGTGLPFSFTALLGLLSLSGMLIKNGIVLVEEIDLQRKEGLQISDAVVLAGKSRIRPVVLAAVTTILGMLPLLGDAFFASMAVTIMGGLAFATVLTLIAAPVFYYTMFPGARKAERLAK